MASTVYFVGRRATSFKSNLPHKIQRIFDKAGLGAIITKNDLVAIKLHFGERGVTTYIHPVFVRQVVEKVKESQGKPFLVDTNTLYIEMRHNAVDHLQTALQHGFSYATVPAPIVIADGLRGHSSHDVKVDLKHFDTVKIADGIDSADSMVVLTHVKTHILTGLGGVIKNLSMGCASRAGKHMMHSTIHPKVNEKCKGCGHCLRYCPEEAIFMNNKVAYIDEEKCIGCGECIAACAHDAIEADWSTETDLLQERMAEFAYGAVKNKKGKCSYISFVMDVTPHCDCHPWSDVSIVPDVGILASFDPVAIDQAAVDLINRQAGVENSGLKFNHAPGEDKFKGTFPKRDYTVQLRYAEEIGLGSRSYELIELEN